MSASGRWVVAMAGRSFQSDRYVVIYDTHTCRFQRHPAIRFQFHPTQDRLAVLAVKKMKRRGMVWSVYELDLTKTIGTE